MRTAHQEYNACHSSGNNAHDSDCGHDQQHVGGDGANGQHLPHFAQMGGAQIIIAVHLHIGDGVDDQHADVQVQTGDGQAQDPAEDAQVCADAKKVHQPQDAGVYGKSDAEGAGFPEQLALALQLVAGGVQQEKTCPFGQQLQRGVVYRDVEIQKQEEKSPKQLVHE